MKNKKTIILFSILIALFCITVVPKTFPNDTFFSIKLGDYILHNGIDFVEHFNFNELVHHNARWLFNVIVAFLYNNYNFIGVYIFTIINSVLIGLIMFNSSLKRTKDSMVSFIITLITIELVGSSLVARAQIMSYLLLLLEVIFIEKLIKENKIKYLLILLPISVFIANIHTTVWLMTLILFLPYFAEYIISKIFKSKVLYSETSSIKLLVISFVLVGLSGLLTPLGFLPYTYIFKTLSGISSTFILEMKKPNIFLTFSLLVPFIMYIYLLVFKRKRIKISDLFLVLGLFFMSLMASRNIPYLLIIGSLSISRLFKDNINFNIIKDLYKSKLFMVIITILTILLSLVFLFKNNYNEPYVDEKMYPVKASDYILKNIDLDSLRLYNDFDNGAYLEFRGIKVFLDSRAEMYCKEFNDTSILEDWLNASRLTGDYELIFDKYNFNYILLYKTEPLNIYVSNEKDYELVYSDEYFMLYKKVE